MRPRPSTVAFVTVLFALLFVGTAPFAQVAKPSGAATPQEAVAVIKKAAAADDFCDFDCIVIDEDFFDLKSEDFRSMDEVIDDVIDNEYDDDDGTLI